MRKTLIFCKKVYRRLSNNLSRSFYGTYNNFLNKINFEMVSFFLTKIKLIYFLNNINNIITKYELFLGRKKKLFTKEVRLIDFSQTIKLAFISTMFRYY